MTGGERAIDREERPGSRQATALLPEFFIVGAAKAGTTSLHHYLRQHPGVFIPAREEPNFFAFDGCPVDFRGPDDAAASVNRMAVTDLEEYLDLFRAAPDGAVRGDVSPLYLYWPGTAARIRSYVPDAKICIVLRNPVDRAYSAYMHAVREGKEPLPDFEAALAAEPERIAANWGFLWRYADLGRYARQVEEYLDVFPRHRIRICLYDDLQSDPSTFLHGLQDFIGVEPGFRPDLDTRYNSSGVPRSRWAYAAIAGGGPLRRVAKVLAPVVGRDRLLQWQARLQRRNLRRISLAPEVRQAVARSFQDDIDRTALLTGVDLSRWRI